MTPVLPQGSNQDEELCNILFRRQQLQYRLQFLKEIQKKNNRIEGSLANEEGPPELDRIEEELKLLEQKEKDLLQKKKQCVTTQPTDKDPFQAPIQGLYVLPGCPDTLQIVPLQEENTETIPQVEKKETIPKVEKPVTVAPKVVQKEDNTETTVSLDDLSMSPAKVKCPSCKKCVMTEIHYKLGSNTFLFCCLLSVVGCLAGCCLVPFCLNRFKDIVHKCPSCHKDIRKVNRF